MNDLTPNDLSHMSDEDFNALCPQGHHALGAEPLSPAAQEVDNAIADIEAQIEFADLASGFNAYRKAVAAAALRAVADQVAPKRKEPRFAGEVTHADWFARDDVRDDILTIAAELDPTSNKSGNG